MQPSYCDKSDDCSACQTRVVVVLIVSGFHAAARRNMEHIHQLLVSSRSSSRPINSRLGLFGAPRRQNAAPSTFNDDGPFYWSVSSQSAFVCHCSQTLPCLWTPCEVLKPFALLPRLPSLCSLIPLMRNVSYMVARGSEGRRLVQRYSRSKVASSIPQTPALFNVSATRRSLLMAPSNPLPLSKETCEEMIRLLPACVCVHVCVLARCRICQAVLSPRSSQSHRARKHVPVAKQLRHTASWPIST